MALGDRPIKRACVIGSGPNGLAAAIRLAEAGIAVDVFEAESVPGGGARTMELTLPGFQHDFGSAVHPLGVGSPYFRTLPLASHGLEWISSPLELAHPLDDGSAVCLYRSLAETAAAMGEDGPRWRRFMTPLLHHWDELAAEVLGPVPLFPRHPILMARFGIAALPSAKFTANRLFRTERAKAIFAGLAAHSFLAMDEPLSSAVGLFLGVAAHAVGWPIPRGGSQAITRALSGHLESLGGRLHLSHRIARLEEVLDYDLVLADVTPRQIAEIAGSRLEPSEAASFAKYRYGAGVFKVDYALNSPIPWQARECRLAATVHLGGSFEDIAASERAVRQGKAPDQPYVLVAQPSLFDSSRAPDGRHTAWAYCHIPNGSQVDMLPRIEAQFERFAPGFADCVVARSVLGPTRLESMNANLVGGDINGGAYDIGQFLFRPTRRGYATSLPGLYICSSSTPPSGGVHGMCGFHSATRALKG